MNNFSNQDEIINFSFILNEENKIDIENLPEPLIIQISGKNPKNLITENVSFNKYDNIIRLPNGDELFKIIAGKALRNNKELIDDEKKEVGISIKYQILSKNTALYAEIKNDYNNLQENKLITVNLNEYLEEPIFQSSKMRNSSKKKGRRVFSMTKSHKLAVEDLNTFSPLSFGQMECAYSLDGIQPIVLNEEIKEIKSEKENKDLTKLIMSQNIIEGFWEENEETKKLLNIIDKDVVKKINEKIKHLNKGNQQNKIKYTILVIYYLNTKYFDKLNEYRLIINKANKFLLNQGIKYEDIIKGI